MNFPIHAHGSISIFFFFYFLKLGSYNFLYIPNLLLIYLLFSYLMLLYEGIQIFFFNLLVVYRTATNFYIFILYLVTQLNSFVNSNSSFLIYFICFKASLYVMTVSFLSNTHTFFPCLIAIARTTSRILTGAYYIYI